MSFRNCGILGFPETGFSLSLDSHVVRSVSDIGSEIYGPMGFFRVEDIVIIVLIPLDSPQFLDRLRLIIETFYFKFKS